MFAPRARRWQVERARSAWRATRGLGARALKPVVGVALAVGVLLAAQALWFDDSKLDRFDELATEIAEARQQLEHAQAGLAELGDPGAGVVDGALSPRVQQLIGDIDGIKGYFERTDSTYPGRFFLAGAIGLIDEELALFFEARGDEERASARWTAALRSYQRGAEAGDPVALLHLGIWYLDRGDPKTALRHLRRAHERWPLLDVPGGNPSGHVAMKYHVALLALWKAERDPSVAVEAWPLEERALRDLQAGQPRETTFVVLYNAACLRALMIRAGVRDAVEGIGPVEFLRRSFEAAGASRGVVAEWLVADPDLEGLRGVPAFDRLVAEAEAILAAGGEEK